jgi:hypothetical protein
MGSNYSKKAKFEDVKFDPDAVKFHAENFMQGQVYPLAKHCYGFIQQYKTRSAYQVYLNSLEEKEIKYDTDTIA